MAEPTPAQRLAELRQRFDRDPKSRVFLQLAEEYRRAGRLAEAVRVLESGLAAHPTYVAAQVVLGRCLLETGDSPRAVTVLEKAVAADGTQLVANRLLVEAYLATENVGKARARLDVYRQLNDRDTEIEGLEKRIGQLGGEARPILRRGRDRSGEHTLPPATTRENGSSFGALRAPDFASSPAPSTPTAPNFPRTDRPFGRIADRRDEERILAHFAASAIFPVALRSDAARSGSAPVPEPGSLTEAEERFDVPTFGAAAADPGFPELPDSAPEVQSPISPIRELDWIEESESDGVPSTFPTQPAVDDTASPVLPANRERPAAASATLGDLYLSQGHLEDAAESYESVLDLRPDDADALAGLAEVRRRKSAEQAAFFDEAPSPVIAASPMVGGLTARKIERLRQFMVSMRRGAQPDVS